MHYCLFYAIFILLNVLKPSLQIQYRSDCVPESSDNRYSLCKCQKYLNIDCEYRRDINQVSGKNLDSMIKPLRFNKTFSNNNNNNNNNNEDSNLNVTKQIRTYIPNFNQLTIPYEIINLKQFPLISQYTFYNQYHLINNIKYTMVFLDYKSVINTNLMDDEDDSLFNPSETDDGISELTKDYNEILFDEDTAIVGTSGTSTIIIDKNAFTGIQNDFLLIEGDYDLIKINKYAFQYTRIKDVSIHCFKKLNNNYSNAKINPKICQLSVVSETLPSSLNITQQVLNVNHTLIKQKFTNTQNINAFKLFGITLELEPSGILGEWNIDQIPNINEIKILHIESTKNRYNGLRKLVTKKPNEILVSLNELNLRDNAIEHLTEDFFMKNKLSNLTYLKLTSNLIQRIDLNTFLYLSKLETLYLDDNKLINLPKAVFSSLKQLKHLYLKRNQLTNIVKYQFEDLINLKVLDLSSNQIKQLDSNDLFNLNQLVELRLMHNPFEFIDKDAFKPLNKNKIKLLDLTSQIEHNWFFFENNDICLLKPFACNQTKILLSTEQNCDCFLHYLNMINNYGEYIEIGDVGPSNTSDTTASYDNSISLQKCNIECNNNEYLPKCFLDSDSVDYSDSCLYQLLYPSKTTSETSSTTLIANDIEKPIKSKYNNIMETSVASSNDDNNNNISTESESSNQLNNNKIIQKANLTLIDRIIHTTRKIHEPISNQNPCKTNPNDKKCILFTIDKFDSTDDNSDDDNMNNDESIRRQGIYSVRIIELTNLTYLSIFLSCISLVLLFIFTIIFSLMHARYRKHAIYSIVARNE